MIGSVGASAGQERWQDGPAGGREGSYVARHIELPQDCSLAFARISDVGYELLEPILFGQRRWRTASERSPQSSVARGSFSLFIAAIAA